MRRQKVLDHDRALRQHLIALLNSANAHLTFDDVIKGWPVKLRGSTVTGVPYTAWQLLEHLRIAQWDILEFSYNPQHVSPEWTAGYWPPSASPPSAAAWNRSMAAFRHDRQAMQDLVTDPATDLFAPIPHGDGQTVLREALLVADHNAYHVGQLVLLRRLLGAWPAG